MKRTGILFESEFETGDLTGFYGAGNTPEVVSTGHPVRAGNYSMRAHLHRTESGCAFRTMVIVQANDEAPPDDSLSAFMFDIGSEYWVGFSIYVQPDLVSDPPELSDCVFQCQAMPDSGETYRSPCVALVIDTVEEGEELVNYWRLWRLSDTRALSPGMDWEHANWFQLMLPMDEADIGGWTDWVFHIIWDYDDDGLLQVWRNGVQVLDVAGGNCSNDQKGPYCSFGAYKWPWRSAYKTNSNWRLLYFDEFRIGDASSSLEDMMPDSGYESTMLVLPQDATLARLVEIMTEAYPLRRTFGFSYDDAGVLGGTAVLYDIEDEQKFIDWYAKHYPEVDVKFRR